MLESVDAFDGSLSDRTRERDQERGRAELARLGLIAADVPDVRWRAFSFEPGVALGGRKPRKTAIAGGMALAKPVDTITRLVLLLGAGTIASLAVLFG